MPSITKDIPLNLLSVSNLNTRRDLDAGQEDSSVEDLALSIQEKGLIQPITVRKLQSEEENYEVIIGQRRLLACRKIGYDPVPCLVRDDLDDTEAVTISLIENVHRADLNPLDKARALRQLYDRCGSYEKVAKETSWSAQTVSKYVSLLDLPEEIQNKISTSDGAAGVGSLSKLARTFQGDEAIDVYEQISGFTQKIQTEIIKRSEGDISKIGELRGSALEGAFEIRHCGGQFKCEIIRDILEGELGMKEFEDLVQEVALNVSAGLAEGEIKAASRGFWKSLAT